MNEDNLSLNNMVEFAMGISMSSLFQKAMTSSYDNLQGTVDSVSMPVPPKFVYAIIEGRQQGPFSLGEVAALIKNGAITKETYIWKQGMYEWKPAKYVDDLSPELSAIPPQIPQIED